MVKITHVRFKNGKEHENIVAFYCFDTTTGETISVTKENMIKFINQRPNTVFVEDSKGLVEVFVIDDNPKYLRTKKDGRPTNNLLNLPEF